MPYSKKILSSDEAIQSWRGALMARGETVALVAGTFDLFQPGNLLAIRRASKLADRVVAWIEPDDPGGLAGARTRCRNALDIRSEAAAYLKDVAAVIPGLPGLTGALRSLRPFTLVDCSAQTEKGPGAAAARPLAAHTESLLPIGGCFTREIARSVREGRTPIALPEHLQRVPGEDAGLEALFRQRQGRGIKLVTINGCFDLLHIGHLRILGQARLRGDRLIVLVNDDESVRRYKGPARPVFPIVFRRTALLMLEPVSAVLPFSGDNPLAELEKIAPDVHVKGGSFEENRVLAERELVESKGGSLVTLPFVAGYSSTRLVQSMKGCAP